jgi:beta-1,2-mannosidase
MTGWQLGPFHKQDAANPCLTPRQKTRFTCPFHGPVDWEAKDVFNPAAVVREGRLYLLYRAEDTIGRHAGTSRIGLASSSDGLHFQRENQPVLYPAHDAYAAIEWEGGCEDPRIVEREAGGYVLTYTAYDGTLARLCVATSPDLRHWQKHGPAFGSANRDLWSKSGAIVCRRAGERLLATRINGRYWMYWGESDVFLAHSEDLISWELLLDPSGVAGTNQRNQNAAGQALFSAMSTRPGQFDSDLVEPGPPAVLTEQGIVLIYNGKNSATTGDPALSAGTYAAGQALFAADEPGRLIGRSKEPFLVPERPYEHHGQVGNVCFVEGLVPFGERWHLYYGTADSHIAVAISAGF